MHRVMLSELITSSGQIVQKTTEGFVNFKKVYLCIYFF